MFPITDPHFPVTDAHCEDIGVRRRQVRARLDVNGIDYVEVDKDTADVMLYLLKAAVIDGSHIYIEGLTVTQAVPLEPAKRGGLRKAKPGSPAIAYRIKAEGPIDNDVNYILRLGINEDKPDSPLPGFDPLLSKAEFSFGVDEVTDRDLPAAPPCPPPELDEPDMYYLAKDYASFRQLVLDRLALIMPQWRERHVPDLGITLIELLAYVGDYLSYYQDAVATEAYLNTARQRISVRRHARLVDYRMHEGCNARALLCLTVDGDIPEIDLGNVYFITDYGLTFPLRGVVSRESELKEAVRRERYEIFEPVEPFRKKLYYAHNQIDFHTWGERECCLPKGATRAALRDGPPLSETQDDAGQPQPEELQEEAAQQSSEQEKDTISVANAEMLLRDKLDEARVIHPRDKDDYNETLKKGDVLIFEEKFDPSTGLEEDADPAHRHAVRLTKVTRAYDLVNRQAVLEIEWDRADALPFPLCLSATTDECDYKENISVARGNVILVDHGETIEEDLDPVEPIDPQPTCDECGEVLYPRSRRYRPHLTRKPVVFREEPRPKDPIQYQLQLQRREPRAASPQLVLTVVDEIRVAEAIAKAVEDAADAHTVQDTVNEILERIDGDDKLSFAAKAEAWQIKDAIDAAARASSPADKDALIKICTDKVGRLSSELRSKQTGRWLARNDLLASGGDDRDFVVEVDDDGVAHLRFGDDELGEQPAPNTQFHARYRTGEPLAGNVGAEAIRRLIVRTGIIDGVVGVRNPLAATGGTAPEKVADVKLRAPHAFRQQLRRAITEEDYARLVERQVPGVQKAYASLTASTTQTGRYTVNVWFDPLSGAEVTGEQVADSLYSFRRIGHDVVAAPGRLVPLNVEITVKIKEGAIGERVKEALEAALGSRGFFCPDRLTFETGISLSQIAAAAQRVAGVAYVSVVKVEESVESPRYSETWPAVSGTDTDLIKFEPNEIPMLGKLTVTCE